MGLYLCVFDDSGEELDGVEVGSYADWGRFVSAVVELEGVRRGARYPLLTMHSDSDGEWSAEECVELVRNLNDIATAFRGAPPVRPAVGTWQAKVVKQLGPRFGNLYESFIDVDGENLIDRLKALAELSQKIGRPVVFQ